MDKPLISVGLLTYNHEKYISDCLKGILSQTYPRMELIILDDASPDNTVKIIEEYMPKLEEKFERINFIKHKQNSGNVPKNCNEIISQFSGELYFGASGDDILLPNCVNTLYENLISHPECSVIHANGVYIDDDFHFGDMPDMLNLFHLNKSTGIEPYNLFNKLMMGNYIYSTTCMFYTKILKKYGLHDESISYEDYEYLLRLSSNNEKIFYLNQSVVLYRRAITSISHCDLGDYEQKLRISIDSGYKTRKKYIHKLNNEEVIQCWDLFYKGTLYRIKQKNCYSLLPYLKRLLNNENFNVATYDTDKYFARLEYENKLIKKLHKYENNLILYLNRLFKIKNPSVAIYGFSDSGKELFNILINTDIVVKYIIDKKGDMLNAKIPVYRPTDSMPYVDIIIVAPIKIFETVYPLIKNNCLYVFDLEKLLEKETISEI